MKINNKRVLIIILLIVLITISLSVVPRMIVRQKEPIKIIFIPKVIDEKNEFWSALTAGSRMAADEYNVDLTIVAPDKEEDYEEQNRLVLWAIDQKPDAIMIAPSHYTESYAAASKVVQHNITLLLVDSEVEQKVADSLVATDNFIAGNKMGRIANEYIDDSTQIAIVGHVKTSSTAIERIRGLKYAIGNRSDQIVDTVFCDSMFDKAYDITVELMKDHPEINMIIGTNEYAAVGAANAIKDLGLSQQVKMIGFDNSIEEVQLLEEGVFLGLVIQKPFNMGYLAVRQTIKAIKGDTEQQFLDSGSEIITKENMYTEQNQKLLFPFVGRQFRDADN